MKSFWWLHPPSWRRFSHSLLLVILCLFPPSLPAGEPGELPDLLDFDRREAENFRLELTPYGGDYAGDKLNHSFVAGANLQVNLTPALGIATDFGYSRAAADAASPLEQSFSNRNLYLVDAGFVVTKPAAYQSKKKAVEADFFTSIGGGEVRFNNTMRGMGFIGGGMKTRFKKIRWLALRVEVRNYFLSIPNPGGSDFEDDLTIGIGSTFLLIPEN